MKKILFLFTAFTFSNFTFAEALKCKTDYPVLKKQIQDEVDIIQTGTIKDLIMHYENTDYAQLFRDQHENKVFDGQDWIEEKEYLENTLESFELLKSAYTLQKIKFHSPKANFLTSYGEVCIVPISSIDQVYQEKISSQYDAIFVRDLRSNQWRNLVYSGVELKVNMDEFFPNLSQQVKLAAFQTDDGKNFADLSEKMAYMIFKEMGLTSSAELDEEIQLQIQPLRQRLKDNGF